MSEGPGRLGVGPAATRRPPLYEKPPAPVALVATTAEVLAHPELDEDLL
ncbi:4-phosphopantetheinyl transferase, partial [Streptomyces parvus]|nr:4-phosphopantetheinyl transferase [Streptomyces parvus]